MVNSLSKLNNHLIIKEYRTLLSTAQSCKQKKVLPLSLNSESNMGSALWI